MRIQYGSKAIRSFTAAVLLLASGVVLAADSDVGAIATSLTTSIGNFAKLLYIISYVAGIGFAIAGILQLKAHKEQPQQVPLSKPIVILIVAACLMFLPSVMSAAGASIFGTAQSAGSTAPDTGGK